MTDTLSKRYKVNLVLTVLFTLGIGISLYFIYSLPYSLRLSSGYQPEFLKVYVVIGLTFLLGALTLTWALGYKKEIIVFRDRLVDTSEAEREAAEQAGKTTISLDSVRASISDAQTTKDAMVAALKVVCKQLEAGQGAIYLVEQEEGNRRVVLKGGYALSIGESAVLSFEFGEGLVGQSAATAQTLYVEDIPEGYINIISGLGSSSPRYLLIVPVVSKTQVVLGVIEIASFVSTTDDQRKFVEESAQLIAEKII